MRTRRFIPMTPTHYAERPVGAFRLMHEKYSGFIAEAHAHDELQVTVPIAGRMLLRVAGEEHLIGPEGVIVLPAHVPHAVGQLDGALDYLVVSAPAGWLAETAAALGAPSPPADRAWVVAEPFLWPLARQLAAEVDTAAPGGDRLLAAGIEQLAVCLARGLAAAAPAPAADPRILRAVDRILRDHADDLTVAALAAEAHMTARHFERRFKAAVGAAPRRYLIDVRLAAARTLLESTDLPVTRIAVDVGFGYASHFIETFRKASGTTPQAWREARRT